MKIFFDDPRTLEVFDIIKSFRDENGVGISIYPAADGSESCMYSLIGFDTAKLKMKYILGRHTDDIPLKHIGSLNDALLAFSNAKLRDRCLDFEIYILFDDKTGKFSSIEFFKEVPGTNESRNHSVVKYFHDERTMAIVDVVKYLGDSENCGIMVIPVDKDESSYVCSAFDYVVTKTGMKYRLHSDFKNKVIKAIKTFDDVVLAMSNAKVHKVCERFEMRFSTATANGLPAMMFYKV